MVFLNALYCVVSHLVIIKLIMPVRGIGELPTVAAPVAVTNAVLDARAGLGVRHIDTPLTPEKIWRALQGAGRGEKRQPPSAGSGLVQEPTG
jgi:hypothetical protein